MARDDLKQTLEELHNELATSGHIDADDRAALLGTLQQIKAVLAKQEVDADDAGMSERVSEEIRRFENSHPRFSELLARVAESLSNLGI